MYVDYLMYTCDENRHANFLKTHSLHVKELGVMHMPSS